VAIDFIGQASCCPFDLTLVPADQHFLKARHVPVFGKSIKRSKQPGSSLPAAICLLVLLPCRLCSFLVELALSLVLLVQQLLLLLDCLAGLPGILLGADALSLNWHRSCHTQPDHQHKNSDTLHILSEQKILQRSYTEAAAAVTSLMLLL
jgi:hypothetical protein